MAAPGAILLLVLLVILSGCGEDDAGVPETRLAAALATVTGPEPVGTGFGWIDVERLRTAPGPTAQQLEWAAPALGPGARQIGGAGESLRRIGINPLDAESMISIVTSYTLALRIDGVDPSRAEAAFRDAGARERRVEGWETFDLGPEWTVPLGTSIEPVGSLASRSAVRPETLMLARSDLARAKMLSSADPAIEAASVAAAADCLGDIVAARLVLDNHTHLSNVGPDLLAFGVAAPGLERPQEVLCAIGEPGAEISSAAEALEHAFDRDTRDRVTGEPTRSLVADSEVELYDQGALRVIRAELSDAPATEPGLLFRLFDRGSLLTYMGLQPPPPG